jgi:hypothetical protein
MMLADWGCILICLLTLINLLSLVFLVGPVLLYYQIFYQSHWSLYSLVLQHLRLRFFLGKECRWSILLNSVSSIRLVKDIILQCSNSDEVDVDHVY